MVSAAASRRITSGFAGPSAGLDVPGVSPSDTIHGEFGVPAQEVDIASRFGRSLTDRAANSSGVLNRV